ncbi:hypothetical protein PIB30_092742 [Stylosanthes scabra]|uniref:Uncharacterized protein n=1 Tax=Stylosanthes scabra TaxID=79078 RepID=A0ABU6XXH4_9FABA|nr:hypothetical protein [Stylosanthes scabra]
MKQKEVPALSSQAPKVKEYEPKIPFPQRLQGQRKAKQYSKFLEGIQTTSAQAIKEEHKPPPKSSKTPPMIKPSKKPKEIHESKTKGWEYKKIYPEGFTHEQRVLKIQPP